VIVFSSLKRGIIIERFIKNILREEFFFKNMKKSGFENRVGASKRLIF